MTADSKTTDGLLRAYRRTHLHLERMLDGLDDDHLQTRLQGTKESISRVLQHIINAELYWLEQVREPRPEFIKRPNLDSTRSMLKALEKLYTDLLQRRGHETETNPTPGWITLRVAQHGIYHSAQIALLRRLLGIPAVPVGETAPPTWESAVDAVAELALETG